MALFGCIKSENRTFLRNKTFDFKFARPAFAPLLQAREKFVKVLRRVADDDVRVLRRAVNCGRISPATELGSGPSWSQISPERERGSGGRTDLWRRK